MMFGQANVQVLIAEDDYLAEAKIKELVETLGYTVVGNAIDGYEAVQMTEELRPDVVLMDIKMPGLDGIEATRQIQERCPTPVVILTALQTPELVSLASMAGVGAYLTKPPTTMALYRSILVAIERFRDMLVLRALNAKLQAEIEERKQAEEKLQVLLEEKQTLLKEVHHRVKNNLAVISSLLDLQSNLVEDQGARAALQESRNRVQSMAYIHERLYKSKDLRQIELGDYIEALAKKLGSAYGGRGIVLSIEADDIRLAVDTAVPCGLIANELISNAYKHAFPGNRIGGNVRIKLEANPNQQVILVISDDGVGLPDGFDLNAGTSLGLQLVNILTLQLHGAIQIIRHHVTDEAQAGTTFVLTFPLS